MPYKCTACGKSFRYKVSQRTHKCPAQQANALNQQSMQLSNTRDAKDSREPRRDPLEENQPMLNVVNNEENKYVLIINDQGQHLLTKESNIEKIQVTANKEQTLEEYITINNKSAETRSAWKPNIPDNSISKKPPETSTKMCSKDEKPLRENANDFFSLIMSPMENGLSSPTAEMEHLRVSSPTEKGDTLKPYSNFQSTTRNMEMNITNTSIDGNFSSEENVANTLQTINEESLKELLYGMDEK